MKTGIPILLALLACSASAQTLKNADMVNTTLAINRDGLGVKACGLNFMAAEMVEDDKANIYDFSVNVWNSAHGLIKAGSQTMTLSKKKEWNRDSLKPRLPGPNLVWIAKRDDSVALRPTKYIKGENAGFVLGGEDAVKTVALLLAAAQGEPMQVSMQYNQDRVHRVIGFRSNLSQDDQSALQECIAALLKRMEAEGPPQS